MYKKYLEVLRYDLPLGESFDIIERKLKIGGRSASVFFTDGLTDGQKTQFILNYLLAIKDGELDGIHTSQDFLEEKLPFLDSHTVPVDKGLTEACRQAEQKMYSGLSVMVAEGLDKIIVMDTREYPGRSPAEPEKEKTLRGAKDGFTENFMENISMIRRRLRDNNLIMKYYSVGKMSKTDIALAYMKNKAHSEVLRRLDEEIKKLDAELPK